MKKNNSAVEKLAKLREELAQVEHTIEVAEAGLDVDAVMKHQARAEVLRRFIATLTTQAAGELEERGAQRAREWIAERALAAEAVGQEITALHAEIKLAHKAMVALVRREVELRAKAQADRLAALVLAQRFALPGGLAVEVPPIHEWSLELQKLVAGMVHASGAPKLPSVGLPASATPTQRREAALRTLHGWLSKSAASLPEAVQGILADAPIPDAIVNPPARPLTPRERRRAEREAEELAGIDRDVAQARRVFDGLGGHVAGGV